jgi:hypothetical protein
MCENLLIDGNTAQTKCEIQENMAAVAMSVTENCCKEDVIKVKKNEGLGILTCSSNAEKDLECNESDTISASENIFENGIDGQCAI